MKKTLIALLLALTLLPCAGVAEQVTTLPYGFELGMTVEQTVGVMMENTALADYTEEDYGNGAYNYTVNDIEIPDTGMKANIMQVQVDQNNSDKTEKLTSISFEIRPAEESIATFRKLLAALTATYGAPSDDPFSDENAAIYAEWGSLDASWQTDDLRITLSLSRMYEESISLYLVSRKNYNVSDLAE